ncbi:MAG: hypothetical protein K2Q34_06950 [Alphaproteobacteria bacterium]|nr:hypothetical protein [Alphaproteobacteria bacterium]
MNLEKCDFSMRMLLRFLSILLVFYASAYGAVELTVPQINANLGHLNDPPGVADANECFAFKRFIDDATNPAGPVGAPNRIAAVHRLRELLNSAYFLNNVRQYIPKSPTEFLSNRLLKLEIGHRNAQNNDRIAALRHMMVRIQTTEETSASGILIPVPDIFNVGGAPHHSWAILT